MLSSVEGRKMKKTVLWALVILAVVAFSSCTFKGTATFRLKNNTSSQTFTHVDFVAVSGGDDDYNAVTMEPDDGHYFYGIEPGTYDIRVTVEGLGNFLAFDDFVAEEEVVYFRDIDDGELP